MATTLTPPSSATDAEEQRDRTSTGGGGFGGRGEDRNGGDGGGGSDWDPAAQVVYRYKLGTWVGMGGIVMVFAAFTSAMVVRSGMGGDWNALALPGVLWFSTAVLLVSSLTIEIAKRRMRAGLGQELRTWLAVTLGLGMAFMVSQVVGWAELSARGIYMASNPSSSFFYLLTAAHAVHIVGGLLALTYAVFRVWRRAVWATQSAAVEATTIYWHFMDGLWVFLLALLSLGW